MSDKKLVKSVLKALSIVELLDEQGEMGVTEISKALGLDKSTAFRLLSTLREKNYIIAEPKTQRYANSGKFFMLGKGVLRRRNINPIVQMELKKLQELTGETVNLAVPEGNEVVYLDSYETEDIIKLARSIGQRRPMYCTSGGKAILAFYKPEYGEAVCAGFEFHRFTEFTILSTEAMLAELKKIRQQGYSVDNQEHSLAIHCVGIPLLSVAGEPVAAVSISMPQYRHENDPARHDRCVQALLDASPALTKALSS